MEVCMVGIMDRKPCLAIVHVCQKLLNAKPEKTSKLPWKPIRTYLQFSMYTPLSVTTCHLTNSRRRCGMKTVLGSALTTQGKLFQLVSVLIARHTSRNMGKFT